ncbi:uncharacterized protein LOC118772640 [Megalops cyprinoides]|uniref:uncharacterized protein LOC118772640 n=1 Tax=Megalops cyprinoides TaxID=118141 RepID=UPI00186495FB|nr:uncharacterized protein LOC118772640 [Megalops cyprinoides]
MSNCVVFQTRLASIVDILVQAAVAVIDNLVEEDSVLLLRLEVAQDEMDNEELKKKIQTQNELISARFASIMGILGKEAVEKIIKLVDETKPQLVECDQSSEHGTAPESSENMLIVEEIEDDVSPPINVDEKDEPFIVVNEEDSTEQPVVLKGKDMSEGRGGRSWVWDHFTLVTPNKVQCGFCHNMLSYNKNTSGMLRHIRTRHPSVHQCGAVFIAGAAAPTEPGRFTGQAELEVELGISEGRGGRSWAWDHFTLFAPNKVQCVFCNNMLSYNKNTSGMLRHLRSRHPSVHQCGTAFIPGVSAHSESVRRSGGEQVRISSDQGGET